MEVLQCGLERGLLQRRADVRERAKDSNVHILYIVCCRASGVPAVSSPEQYLPEVLVPPPNFDVPILLFSLGAVSGKGRAMGARG